MADDAVPPPATDQPALPPAARLRIAALWDRIRSGEDPLAFGAVIVVLALAAGLLWFWAGARDGGMPPAGAASDRSARVGGDGRARPPARTGEPAAGPEDRLPRSAAGAGEARPGSLGAGEGPPGSVLTGEVRPGALVTGGNGAAVETAGPVPGGSESPAPQGEPAVAVHVAGAVLRPGLYHLPGGSRVADAITAAGGRLARADLDRLNLAAHLVDGQKVFVVRRGETVPADVGGGGAVGAGWAGGLGGLGDGVAGPTEPIDLNTADLAALDSLPGIGPATARAILEERARRGGFRSTRDLLRIPGIGEARFARLKDHVRV